MTTPEAPKSPETTTQKPSDILLKNFRATLDARWKEFDNATLEEANAQANEKVGILSIMVDVKSKRDADPDFVKAKKAFTEAKAMLSKVGNDTELKENIQILSTVDSTLKVITSHLKEMKPEEKGKKINIILAKTTADLANFKAEITGKMEDKKEAEMASATEKAIPRKAIAVATTAGGASIISSAEAKTAIDEAKNEVTNGIKKELGPWAMIFGGVKDVPAKEVAVQVKDLAKEYSEKKWTTDPFDKFFSMIKLFFLKWQVGHAGIDLSDDMTPEEMKLAGLNVPSANSKQPKEVKDTPVTTASTLFVARILMKFSPAREKNRDIYDKGAGESSATIIAQKEFQSKTPTEIFALYKKYPTPEKSSGLEKEFGTSEIAKFSKESLWYAIAVIATEESFLSKYTRDNSWKSKRLSELFPGFHRELEVLQGFEKVQSPADLVKYLEADMFSGDGKLADSLTQKIEELKQKYTGLDGELATSLLIGKPKNYADAKIGKSELNEEFLKKLEIFQKDFVHSFSRTGAMSMQTKGYEGWFSGDASLRPHEALKFFIVTGGKTEYSTFSLTEKLMYYKTLISILRDDTKRDTNNASYGLAMATVQELSKVDSSLLPEDLKGLLKNTLSSVAKSTLSETGDMITGIFNQLTPAQKSAVLASVGLLMWIIPQLRIAKAFAIGIATTLGIGSITLATAQTMSDDEIQKKLQESKK